MKDKTVKVMKGNYLSMQKKPIVKQKPISSNKKTSPDKQIKKEV